MTEFNFDPKLIVKDVIDKGQEVTQQVSPKMFVETLDKGKQFVDGITQVEVPNFEPNLTSIVEPLKQHDVTVETVEKLFVEFP